MAGNVGRCGALLGGINVLGWIDDKRIAVDIDSATLGVLSTDTGAVVSVALYGAYKMQMSATLPGAL